MKFAHITTYYPIYVRQFYSKKPWLKNKSYAEQKEALNYDAFGWADFWKKALTPFGYEVMEFVANIEPLQRAWAAENGISIVHPRWLLDIALKQIKEFQPEILFVDDYSTFTYYWLEELRQMCHSIKFIIGWCGAPYQDGTVCKAYDIVLSNIPELVEEFISKGHKSIHMNHAFDPEVLDRLDLSIIPFIDFSFVGQIAQGNKMHGERERILTLLVKQFDMVIHSPSENDTYLDKLKVIPRQQLYAIMWFLKRVGFTESILNKLPIIGKAASWQSMPLRAVSSALKPYLKPAMFGLEMYQTLRNSKLTFNCHISISPYSASNMRMFEATGVGTCLLTDWKENLHKLFEPDKEVVTYQSVDECVERVKWLLDNPEEREAIAKAGQERTLRNHTFSIRAIQLDEIIRTELRKKGRTG